LSCQEAYLVPCDAADADKAALSDSGECRFNSIEHRHAAGNVEYRAPYSQAVVWAAWGASRMDAVPAKHCANRGRLPHIERSLGCAPTFDRCPAG
jgi:hypothetical protein